MVRPCGLQGGLLRGFCLSRALGCNQGSFSCPTREERLARALRFFQSLLVGALRRSMPVGSSVRRC